MGKSGKARSFCLTINNYDQSHIDQLKQEKYKYIIIGDEVAPSTGTKHLQVYISYPNPRSFNAIKSIFPTAHIEISAGDAQQNRDYCSKDCILYEDGTLPAQGNRTDIEVCKDIVKSTNSMREVVTHATSVQGVRIAEIWLKYHEPPRNFKPHVIWIYGPSGVGKTKLAYELAGPKPYTCMKNLKWLEGYDGHETTIIDELRSSFCSFATFLRLIDRYEYRIEQKGSSRQFLSKKIIITSVHAPAAVWDTNEDIYQLHRRIDEIKNLNIDIPCLTPELNDMPALLKED